MSAYANLENESHCINPYINIDRYTKWVSNDHVSFQIMGYFDMSCDADAVWMGNGGTIELGNFL